MSRNQRFTLIGLAALVAVVAAIVIGTGGSSDDSSNSSAPGPATVVVRDGKPVGGVQTVTVRSGDDVDLTVKSDTADEVHFHGYDVHKDVEAGGTVHFAFPATIQGEFIVELEDAGQTLAKVQVVP